jgi:hypothetical protein
VTLAFGDAVGDSDLFAAFPRLLNSACASGSMLPVPNLEWLSLRYGLGCLSQILLGPCYL